METKTPEPTIEGEINMKVLSESIVGMRALMNKAMLKGSYDLDDAGSIMTFFSNIVKSAEQLDRCQKTLKSLLRSAEQKKKADDIDVLPVKTV